MAPGPRAPEEEKKKSPQWEHVGKAGTSHYRLVKGKAMEGHTCLSDCQCCHLLIKASHPTSEPQFLHRKYGNNASFMELRIKRQWLLRSQSAVNPWQRTAIIIIFMEIYCV